MTLPGLNNFHMCADNGSSLEVNYLRLHVIRQMGDTDDV
jgi:hypothetical protein